MSFDPNKPVYVIKPVSYGSGSVYPISDHPLSLHHIPPRYRTAEYIQQVVPKQPTVASTFVSDGENDSLGEMIADPKELVTEAPAPKVTTKTTRTSQATAKSAKTTEK